MLPFSKNLSTIYTAIASALLALVLVSCASSSNTRKQTTRFAGSGGFSSSPRVSYSAPQIINGSQWDPKERQRSGLSYSQNDFSAFRRNGAQAYIARTGKGELVDPKSVPFLRAANRQGMLLGTYHYCLPNKSAKWQADRYVDRVKTVARQAGLRGKPILLVADFDSKTKAQNMLRFLQRVEERTGVRPVVYLENSDRLRVELQSASSSIKNKLRRYPLWIALYSSEAPENSIVNIGRPLTPELNTRSYGVWRNYALWQYGGVLWENRRSTPKVYSYGSFRAPAYFGNLDRPVERSVFKGNDLNSFWLRHSYIPQ